MTRKRDAAQWAHCGSVLDLDDSIARFVPVQAANSSCFPRRRCLHRIAFQQHRKVVTKLHRRATRPAPAVTASGRNDKENKNAVLCFGLFADRDFGGGIRVRRSSHCVGWNREDSIFRFHRTVSRLVDHSHVAASLTFGDGSRYVWSPVLVSTGLRHSPFTSRVNSSSKLVYVLRATGGGHSGGRWRPHQFANIGEHHSESQDQESVGNFGPNRELHSGSIKSNSIATRLG
jgi:hypothetical protein